MKTAIITGASSGLGREFAVRIKNEFTDIEEIWLVARRRERLEALAGELTGVGCRIVCADLSNVEGLNAFAGELDARKPDVRLLINNAGYGKLTDFDESDIDEQLGMIDLNVRGLTAVTRLTLEYMKDNARIINISSIASFVPNARMAVYSASKYYVRAFSRALGMELKKRRIAVTAVCPGPMTTEFEKVAGIHNNSFVFKILPRVTPANAAAGALKSSRLGKPVYTPGGFYKFFRVVSAIIPDTIMMYITRT